MSDGSSGSNSPPPQRQQHDGRDDTYILKPGPHDVLCGRGGGTNNHTGNIRFRQLVNEYKLRYLSASKVEKPKVARDVVTVWRGLTPPGRFLARRDDSKRGAGSVKGDFIVWYDVGDKKAREKASQCLRERTPDVLPFVKEMQRQQDLFTGQGLKIVEQQMQLMQDGNGAVTNGIVTGNRMPDPSSMTALQTEPAANGGFVPPPIHSMSEPEVQNAFSAEYFFTHGFNTAAPAQTPLADDPLSMQQMSQDQHVWNNFQTEFASNAAQQEQLRQQIAQLKQMQDQLQAARQQQQPTDLEPVPLPAGFPKAAAAAGVIGGNVKPDKVASTLVDPTQPTFGEDELTWEEYQESMKPYEGLKLAPSEDELDRKDTRKKMRDMRENSWVRSFHSIERSETDDASSALESLDKASVTLTPTRQKRNTLDASLARQQLLANQGKSTRTVQTAASAMSGVSMFSEMSEDTRFSKMSHARGLASNLSLMSEMTDLSETLQSLDLSRSTNPAT